MNGSIDDNEQIKIKELCKSARKKLGYSNQDIADKIADKFRFTDYSVNTVNNFFSERSKATTVFTAGYICSVLGVSIDKVFDICYEITDEEKDELRRQLSQYEQDVTLSNKEIDKLNLVINEKDTQLKLAHDAVEHYRRLNEKDRMRVPAWAFNTLLIVIAILVLAIATYLVIFDINNSGYGLFH